MIRHFVDRIRAPRPPLHGRQPERAGLLSCTPVFLLPPSSRIESIAALDSHHTLSLDNTSRRADHHENFASGLGPPGTTKRPLRSPGREGPSPSQLRARKTARRARAPMMDKIHVVVARSVLFVLPWVPRGRSSYLFISFRGPLHVGNAPHQTTRVEERPGRKQRGSRTSRPVGVPPPNSDSRSPFPGFESKPVHFQNGGRRRSARFLPPAASSCPPPRPQPANGGPPRNPRVNFRR